MTSWTDYVNFSGAIAGLAVALMSLLLAVFSRYMEGKVRRFFIAFFLIITGYIASDLISQISSVILGKDYMLLAKVTLFLESLFSSMLMPMLSLYLIHCAGENRKKNAFLTASSLLWVVYAVLLIYAQFSTGIYYYTADNVYHRGPYYPVLLIPPVVLMLLNFAGLLFRRKKLTSHQFKGLLLYILIPLCCMVIQMFFYGLYTIVMGTSVASLFLFIFILNEQTDEYVKQQMQNSNQQLSIFALQMRPHFIYNTMTSIYYLVQQDSVKAQRVISDFTNYLRKNYTAITASEPILFSEELEHTKAYLAVEQVRFEGKLFVKYETSVTMFRLPPLTLQPIVENAVKHGVDPDLAPVTIMIRTKELPDAVELTVEDNGVGFSDTEGNSPHEALENIRERLGMMCGGTLSITPRPLGGTVVTIRLPKTAGE